MKSDTISERRTLCYGSRRIEYHVRTADRKTMEIAVNPDRSVRVTAPRSADIPAIEAVLKRKSRWILRQLRFFEEFNPRTPERHYISGETHRYLGKRYRLVITRGDRVSVIRTRNELIVTVNGPVGPDRIKRILDHWYRKQAHKEFQEALSRCRESIPGLHGSIPRMIIKRMAKRWGSLSENNTLTLNTLLVQAARDCIDYVIIHELCHQIYPDHGSSFYALLERSFPDWKKVKQHLEKSMA